jgi:Ca-activated chloride channel family protein
VTPLVFDLSLSVEASGYELEQVYGTPSEDALAGDIMHVETLFPSRTEGGRTKGGVILLEFADTGPEDDVRIEVSYESRDGESQTTADTVQFQDREPEFFENSGIRKAVALARYAELGENWVSYERSQLAGENPDDPDGGIESREHPSLGEWERQSTELTVSPVYRDRFERFAAYFENEIEALGDDQLREELAVLEQVIAAGSDGAASLSPAPLSTAVGAP